MCAAVTSQEEIPVTQSARQIELRMSVNAPFPRLGPSDRDHPSMANRRCSSAQIRLVPASFAIASSGEHCR